MNQTIKHTCKKCGLKLYVDKDINGEMSNPYCMICKTIETGEIH